MADSEIDYRPK